MPRPHAKHDTPTPTPQTASFTPSHLKFGATSLFHAATRQPPRLSPRISLVISPSVITTLVVRHEHVAYFIITIIEAATSPPIMSRARRRRLVLPTPREHGSCHELMTIRDESARADVLMSNARRHRRPYRRRPYIDHLSRQTAR